MQITIARYLSLARTALGMDLAWLSEYTGVEQVLRVVDGEALPFGVAEGDALPWEGSFCMRVLANRIPAVVPDTRANEVTAALPVREQVGIGSYCGSPVHLPDGTLFGMLCCVSRGPHGGLKEHQLRLLESLAASLGEELADEAARRGAPDSVLHRVRRAIEGEGLRMVAQPIMDLSTMRPVGVEALTRFDLPPARPDRWFAEAAELGLGVLLEMAAIRAALRMLDELPRNLYLSLNASPATLGSRELLDALCSVDPRRIVVELTEHTSVADYDALLANLDALRRRGVRIAVDDAGAGYASFRHILSLQPDIIKFDRQMVTGLDVDPARRALVGALVSFAAQMGATLVAEGIETEGELTTLARLGVGCGQGYFLARPAPLPMPDIDVRPALRRRDDEAGPDRAGSAGKSLEERVPAILREVVARTNLDASYLTVWDPSTEMLEHRLVYDPQGLGIPAGMSLPWRETLCYRCREAGILWTNDIRGDIPGTAADDAGLRTFVSLPILGLQGETLGALCGIGRESRYLSDPLVEHLEKMGHEISALLRRSAEAQPRSDAG